MRIGKGWAAIPIFAVSLALPPAFAGGDPDQAFRTVDEAFAEAMKKQEIPGGVLIIVRDGVVAFTRGYGFADLESRTPVNPETTVFYLASVTKCFTATAYQRCA